MKHILITSLLLTLGAGAACAQPVGGIGTSTGSSGGVVGSGTLNPGSTGTITTPSTNSGSAPMYGASPGGAPANAALGSLPRATTNPSTPNQAPAGGVPGTNAGVPGVNSP